MYTNNVNCHKRIDNLFTPNYRHMIQIIRLSVIVWKISSRTLGTYKFMYMHVFLFNLQPKNDPIWLINHSFIQPEFDPRSVKRERTVLSISVITLHSCAAGNHSAGECTTKNRFDIHRASRCSTLP